MTEYFDHCDSRRTVQNFHIFGLDYILEDFNSSPNLKDIDVTPGFVKDNGEKLFQEMFDTSSIKMRMYGSPKELVENVEIFTNFPGSDRHFRDDLDPYFTTPRIYKSLKNQKFICKSDLFVMLQSMVIRSIKNEISELVLLICVFFLKSHEYRFSGIVEFVPFDEKAIDEIWREIHKIPEEILKSVGERSFQQLMKELSVLSGENLFKKLKSQIPNDWRQYQELRIRDLLAAYEFGLKYFGADSFKKCKTYVFTQIKVIIRILSQVIDKRPEMFLPNSEIKKKKMNSTVRMFEDGDQKFAMCSELFSALNNESTGIRLNFKEKDIMFDAILMKDLFQCYGKVIEKVEFIRYPIQRAKHRAVPIMGVASKDEEHFCILAVDVLFEYLRDMIVGRKTFQRYANSDFTPYRNVFIRIQKNYFRLDCKPYFIRTNTKAPPETGAQGEAKDIRDVKADGFTVKDLENELVYLDLTKTFPEIRNHAEVVYAHVDRVKKQKKHLRTCDMYDAVEYCQLICVFERLPTYKAFLHGQGGCGRVPGMKCELCEAEKKEKEQKKALKLGGSEANGVESSRQTTVKAVTSSKNPDFKSSEVLKATESNMAALDTKLTELEAKIASLKAQLASQSEKCELCDEKKKNDEDQKGALQLKGLEINSQTSVKAVTFSDSSDSKPSEVLKVMDSNMEASDSHLTELNAKIASLEAQLSSQSEKSSQLESALLKATQQNELLHLEHIKLQSENEVNKGVMCQLIDKLSINQESPRSIPIVTSSTSLIECIICHIDIFNTQNTIKCPNCRIRFHKECALNYSKDHKECPSCNGTMKESAICLN